MYATTRQFLDYFNLKSLDQLPPLAEIKELDNLSGELALETPEGGEGEAAQDGELDAGTDHLDAEADDAAVTEGEALVDDATHDETTDDGEEQPHQH